jgi:Leucine-rich repeat (LRR) protein
MRPRINTSHGHIDVNCERLTEYLLKRICKTVHNQFPVATLAIQCMHRLPFKLFDTMIKKFNKCPNLNSLRLNTVMLHDSTTIVTQNLKYIHFIHAYIALNFMQPFMANVLRARMLTDLTLDDCDLSEASILTVANVLLRDDHIEKLMICRNHLTNDGVNGLFIALNANNTLRSLDLGGCYAYMHFNSFKFIEHNTSLNRLNLNDMPMDRFEITRFVNAIEKNKALNWIALRCVLNSIGVDMLSVAFANNEYIRYMEVRTSAMIGCDKTLIETQNKLRSYTKPIIYEHIGNQDRYEDFVDLSCVNQIYFKRTTRRILELAFAAMDTEKSIKEVKSANIMRLDISEVYLGDIPPQVTKLTNLKVLRLTNCGIENVPSAHPQTITRSNKKIKK